MKNEHNQEPNLDNESLVDEPTLTLGVLLKTARESKGLSVEAIASQLHLRPTIVQEIEADNLTEVGAATYVRGYVKNYARAVQADPFTVQECLDKQLANDDKPSMQSFSRKTTHQARDGRLMALTYLIVFVLLGLMVWWWFQKSSMETAVDYSQPTAEEMAASAEESSLNADTALAVENRDSGIEQSSLLTGEESQDVNANSLQDAEPSATFKPSASTISQPSVDLSSESAAQTQDAATSTLKLSLTGDCWVKITDATGKTLVSDLKKAGNELNLVGTEPFAVTLGAPQVVTIELNGAPISLEQYPHGKVAKMTLPRAAQ